MIDDPILFTFIFSSPNFVFLLMTPDKKDAEDEPPREGTPFMILYTRTCLDDEIRPSSAIFFPFLRPFDVSSSD